MKHHKKDIITSADGETAAAAAGALDILSKFPGEISISVLERSSPSDILSVALASKALHDLTNDNYLWLRVCVYQFGSQFVKDLVKKSLANAQETAATTVPLNWKRICLAHYRSKTYVAEKCSVASYTFHDAELMKQNTKDAYIIESSASKSGKMLRVPSRTERIYFSALGTVIENVRPGCYHVVWRLHPDDLSILEGTRFVTKITVNDVPVKRYTYSPKYLDFSGPTFASKMLDYELPYKIEVPESDTGTNVYLTFECFSGWSWLERGMDIDFVYLSPCAHDSTPQKHHHKHGITKLLSEIKHKLTPSALRN